MPELPEVEAAKCYLEAQGLVGTRFIGAELRWPRSIRSGPVEDFVLGLIDASVRELDRRGKIIMVGLDQPDCQAWLLIHLGMTGSVPLAPASEARHKFAHNVLMLDDGRELRFTDPRKLGGLWLVANPDEVIGKLGPEPLDPGFTAETLEALLAKRSAPVKPILMDQSIIAGVGNIYADEALIRARVHPLRSAKSLTVNEVKMLHAGLVEALGLAIGKLTLLGITGKPPGTREETREYFLMAREAGVPCTLCADRTQRVVIRGRSAYFCPSCQEL